MKKDQSRNHFLGLAGEYAVCTELAKREINASLTLGNHKAVDIIATNPINNKAFFIQVKDLNIPLDVQLNSIILKLQSTDKKEKETAKKTISEMLKKDGTSAAILAVSGYSKMINNDFKEAEIDLSASIIKEPAVAFIYKVFENRALVYKKLGKTDLAENDEKQNAQLQNFLAFLAQ